MHRYMYNVVTRELSNTVLIYRYLRVLSEVLVHFHNNNTHRSLCCEHGGLAMVKFKLPTKTQAFQLSLAIGKRTTLALVHHCSSFIRIM